MRLKQEVLVVEHVEALVVDNDEVRGAQDHEEDGLQGGDHHLVDGAGDEDEQHAVGEVLGEVRGRLGEAAGELGGVLLAAVLESHARHHLGRRPVDVVPEITRLSLAH